VEPIDETVEAMAELDEVSDVDLLAELKQASEQVLAIVPDCVGISIASLDHGLTFTLVASNEEVANLDGVQYLDGGPCVEAVKADIGLQTSTDDLLDEEDWHFIGQASAASSVASTLTLPILHQGKVSGSVNLYGGSTDSFTGHHEDLAAIFNAWAPGAVVNADLGFATRRNAEQAPARLRDQAQIDTAVGIIAAQQKVSTSVAEERLTDAAQRAGVSEAQLARLVLEAASLQDSD
jgi:hypothetical protein